MANSNTNEVFTDEVLTNKGFTDEGFTNEGFTDRDPPTPMEIDSLTRRVKTDTDDKKDYRWGLIVSGYTLTSIVVSIVTFAVAT